MSRRCMQLLTKLCLLILLSAVGSQAGDRLHGPDRNVSADMSAEGSIVFYREDGEWTGSIPAIFINDRLVGTLQPGEYARVKVCQSDLLLRIAIRGQRVAGGRPMLLELDSGLTTYVKVFGNGEDGFEAAIVDETQAVQELREIAYGSNIVNRYVPTVMLSADGLFEFGSAVLQETMRDTLEKLSRDIRLCSDRIRRIKVIGHSDRIGNPVFNDSLSSKRAQAVADFLAEHGVAVPIDIEGRGSREPIAEGCEGKQGQELIHCLQPDRRVVIELLHDAQ